MQIDNQQANAVPKEIKRGFDHILIRHMEQSIGTTHGLDGLSLDMITVSCLVVLSEREIERESFPSDPPERFNLDSFLEELQEMGLDDHEGLRQKIKELLDKGYIDTASDGAFLPSKPTMDIVSLLDRAFPGMPGMNLVAYLAQTLNEALSGRKDPVFAVNQLDQTLTMHGGGLSRRPSQAKQILTPTVAAAARERRQSAEALKSALSATLRKRQAEERSYNSAVLTGQPTIITAGATVKTVQVKEVFAKHRPASEFFGIPLEGQEVQKTTLLEKLGTTQKPADSSEAAVGRQAKAVAGDSREFSGKPPEAARAGLESTETHDAEPFETAGVEREVSGQKFSASLSEDLTRNGYLLDVSIDVPFAKQGHDEMKVHPGGGGSLGGAASVQQDMATPSDNAVESRIAAFEQDLAMRCPVCSGGKIETKATAKGKTYYVCSQQGCVFVSWGRPFHLECPRCKNPFLIEVTGKAKKTMLRCPRATCRYQQEVPGDEGTSVSQPPAMAQEPSVSTGAAGRIGKKKRVIRRRVVPRRR